MAFTSMVNMPAFVAPVLFGYIVDRVGAVHGENVGFRASFLRSPHPCGPLSWGGCSPPAPAR